MIRPLGLVHAARILRTASERSILVSSTKGLFRPNGYHMGFNVGRTLTQHRQGYLGLFPCPFHGHPTSSVRSGPLALVQGFPVHRPHFHETLLKRKAPAKVLPSTVFQQQCRFYSRHPASKRRPFRFLFKTMAISAAIVVIPAFLIFGAPLGGFILVPIVIGGVVGGALLLTGGLFLFLVLPIAALGGALTLWFYAMPAAVTAKDLNTILKRAQSQDTVSALRILGSDWEIQKASSDEWFRWTFPKNERSLDKISIRMAVFDPADDSPRKQTTLQWMDSIGNEITEHGGNTDLVVDNETREVIKRHKKSSSRRFEIRNNSDTFSVDNLYIIRENDHVLIEIEDDGEKLLRQKWGKKYLELAKIVDKAATELEGSQGLELGEQIVLVQKHKDSFWNRFSLMGNIALRVPFNRTWIHDVTDE